MGSGSARRGGGERVLESRHLVGLFLGVVLLCAVFFSLGYAMGHNQYGIAVHAADSSPLASPALDPAAPGRTDAKPKDPAAPVTSPGEWDFYAKKDDDHLEPAAKTPATVPAVVRHEAGAPPAAAARSVSAGKKPPARYQPPSMPRGAYILQLAALSHEGDALAMADAAQQKRFPAFVAAPGSDKLFRVQVGPYHDAKSAESAQKALEQAGFKAIIKH